MNLLKKEVKKRGLKLVFSEWTIACRVEDKIYLNPNIPKDQLPNILKHEFNHSGKFTTNDFLSDLFGGDMLFTLILCFKHPRAFAHFIPVSFFDNDTQIDINHLIIYLIIFILIIFIIFLI